jgi:hypothetical protein
MPQNCSEHWGHPKFWSTSWCSCLEWALGHWGLCLTEKRLPLFYSLILPKWSPKQLSPKKTIFSLLLRDQRLKNALASIPGNMWPMTVDCNHSRSSGLEKKRRKRYNILQPCAERSPLLTLMSLTLLEEDTSCSTECKVNYQFQFSWEPLSSPNDRGQRKPALY